VVLASSLHIIVCPSSKAKLIRTSGMGKEALEELSGDGKRVEMSGLYPIGKKFEHLLEVCS
jgi:hypothetical protein